MAVAGEGADATSIQVFDDPWLIVNMSVWRSPEHLIAFVYGDVHRTQLRRRRKWFSKLAEAETALWWVPAGHRPTVTEAEDRLTRLRADGPTAAAFTLRHVFAAPNAVPGAGSSVAPSAVPARARTWWSTR